MAFVVAIPARDEADRLPACLGALAAQVHARCDHVVLLLNNCADDSLDVARRLRRALDLPMTIATRRYAAGEAHAGRARRDAMAIAAELAGAGGIVATTDADGVVCGSWVERNLAALHGGAEVVCGRALIDPVEALMIHRELHADDAREVEYASLLDEIHALADPDPCDPLPRHAEQSGASIAVTAGAFARAGGVPPLPSGEDRGFLASLRGVDARIRHAPDVTVTVSGRLVGRAAGGMAETMARRMIRQDPLLDGALEPATCTLRRAQARALARRYWQGGDAELLAALERLSLVPAEIVRAWFASRFFGQGWARLEQASPALRRQPVRRADLHQHREAALLILDRLRRQADDVPADRAGSPRGAPLPAA